MNSFAAALTIDFHLTRSVVAGEEERKKKKEKKNLHDLVLFKNIFHVK